MAKILMNSQLWEQRYGAIQVSVKTLERCELDCNQEVFVEFKKYLFDRSKSLLLDPEFRVRNCIGEIMQRLIKLDGSKVYDEFRSVLFSNIHETFSRDPQGKDASSRIGNFI